MAFQRRNKVTVLDAIEKAKVSPGKDFRKHLPAEPLVWRTKHIIALQAVNMVQDPHESPGSAPKSKLADILRHLKPFAIASPHKQYVIVCYLL